MWSFGPIEWTGIWSTAAITVEKASVWSVRGIQYSMWKITSRIGEGSGMAMIDASEATFDTEGDGKIEWKASFDFANTTLVCT